MAEHPVRRRPGTKARRRSRSSSPQPAQVVSVGLLALAAQMPAPYGLAALVTTFAGLRGGGTFALASRHLRYGPDGAVTRILVERAIIEISGQPATFGPPKSDTGIREIAVPHQIGELLAEHRRTLPAGPDVLLFTTRTGKLVTTHRRSCTLAVAKAKVPGTEQLKWHGPRHTGLTLAVSVPGTTIRNLMDRGGHSTPERL